MTKRALVLGGGGPVGIAWETGMRAGLSDAGIPVSEMDFVLATSAGSCVGAQLALGQSPAKMLEAQIALGGAEAASGAKSPKFDPSAIHAIVAKMPTDRAPDSVRIDAAAGHRRVLALAVMTPVSGPMIAGQMAREAAAVDAAGGQALVVAPNAPSLGVFPSNLMNAAGRAAIAEAGFAQGRAQAARVGDFVS